jgi:hypothetical protein
MVRSSGEAAERSEHVTEFFPIFPAAASIGATLVAAFAFRDFHRPHDPLKLRYAVSRPHYFLAVAIYIEANIILFVVTIAVVRRVLTLIPQLLGNPLDDDLMLHAMPQTSLMLSILLVVAAPYLPVTRWLFAQLRRFVHALALYPRSVQLLMTTMATAPFKPQAGTGEQLEDALARYSVPHGSLQNRIFPNALRPLVEVWSLRQCFDEIARSPDFAGFFEARAATLGKLDVDLHKVLRRVAKVLLSVDPASNRQLRVLSQFLAEDCGTLVEEYRALLAEAAMSSVIGQEAREKLLQTFGYKVSLPQIVPYLSIVVGFGLYMLWPLINLPSVADRSAFPRVNIVTFVLAHAICLTAAVAWAICPKMVYGFARPSSGKLIPTLSYAMFGAFSFFTCVLVSTGLRLLIKPTPGMPSEAHPVQFILINALAYLFITVCMSVLIDLRLRTHSHDYRSNRWRDALALAFTLLAAGVIFQTAMWAYLPDVLRHSWQPFIYLVTMFALGFLLGYFVPSVAAAYMLADELIAAQVPSDADFLAQIKRRKLIDAAAVHDRGTAPT